MFANLISWLIPFLVLSGDVVTSRLRQQIKPPTTAIVITTNIHPPIVVYKSVLEEKTPFESVKIYGILNIVLFITITFTIK